MKSILVVGDRCQGHCTMSVALLTTDHNSLTADFHFLRILLAHGYASNVSPHGRQARCSNKDLFQFILLLEVAAGERIHRFRSIDSDRSESSMKVDAMKRKDTTTMDRDAKSTEYAEHILTLTTDTDNAFDGQQHDTDPNTENHTKPLQNLSEEEMVQTASEQSLRETPIHTQHENAENATSQIIEKTVLNRTDRRAAARKDKDGSSYRVGAFPVGGTGQNQDEDLTVSAIVMNNNSMEDMENGNLPVAYTVAAELAPSEENRRKDEIDTQFPEAQEERPARQNHKRQCVSTRNLFVLLAILLLLAAGGVVGAVLATRHSNGSSSSTSLDDDDSNDGPRSNDNDRPPPGPDIDSPECDLDPICAETKANGVGGH